jgi:hypothetical protein
VFVDRALTLFKVFWSLLPPIFGGLFHRERTVIKSDNEMGTVLSFSPRDKTPPYAMEYNANNGGSIANHHIHNNHYSNYNNQQRHYSKENILAHNNNAMGGDTGSNGVLLNQADKAMLEKGMKKHNMFLNALSWKRFTG